MLIQTLYKYYYYSFKLAFTASLEYKKTNVSIAYLDYAAYNFLSCPDHDHTLNKTRRPGSTSKVLIHQGRCAGTQDFVVQLVAVIGVLGHQIAPIDTLKNVSATL